MDNNQVVSVEKNEAVAIAFMLEALGHVPEGMKFFNVRRDYREVVTSKPRKVVATYRMSEVEMQAAEFVDVVYLDREEKMVFDTVKYSLTYHVKFGVTRDAVYFYYRKGDRIVRRPRGMEYI